jgi:hypothetical protein
MWLEAVFSLEDLTSLIAQVVPVKIPLGHPEGHDHYIQLNDARDVTLVAGVGLRVTCSALVHWPVVGVDVPIRVDPLTVVLKPIIVDADAGETVAFALEIEHSDIVGIPTLIDRGVAEKLNHKLVQRHIEVSWNFENTLSHSFDLPASLEPLDGLDLRVAWGKIRVTEEAMVMAISFRPRVLRHDRAPVELLSKSTALVRAPERRLAHPRRPVPKPVVVATCAALAVGTFLAARSVKHALA